jgi:hypothetical protein
LTADPVVVASGVGHDTSGLTRLRIDRHVMNSLQAPQRWPRHFQEVK